MCNYDKPFLTVESQLDLLESRNIIISDRAFASRCISSHSYYAIVNGQKDIFLKSKNPDEYSHSVRFEDLYMTFIARNDVDNILFKYTLYVERTLKNQIASLISGKYGISTDKEQGYLKKVYYSSSNPEFVYSTIEKLTKYINEPSPKTSCYYYQKNKNHIPPWILANDISFGLTYQWYRMLKPIDKFTIVKQMLGQFNFSNQKLSKEQANTKVELRKELFVKSLDLILNYRNFFAHRNKIHNSVIGVSLPKNALFDYLPNNVLEETEYDNGIGKNDYLALLISILSLINDRYILRGFFADLEVLYVKYDKEIFSNLSFKEVVSLPPLERAREMFEKFESRIK